MQPPEWTEDALCKGMDPQVFFPGDGLGVQQAAAICRACPVASPCLEYALVNRIQHGVFGGLSERARDRLLRERRRQRAATAAARRD